MVTKKLQDEHEISLSELEARPHTVDVNEYDDIPPDAAFVSLIADLGMDDDKGKVNVYKLKNGDYAQQLFLFDCAPNEFNLTLLQNPEYHADGFGKFRVMLRDAVGIRKSKVIEAVANAKLYQKLEKNEQANPNADILNMMKAMHESTQALILSLNRPQANEAKTTVQFLQEMQLMRDVMGMNNQAPAQQSPLEILELAKELALAMNPDANTGIMTTMGKMLEKYGEPIINAIANAPPKAPIAPPLRPVLPAHIPVAMSTHSRAIAENPPILNNPVESADDMSFMLKMYLNQLIQQAKRNGDVELYADLILDQVGDEIYALIEAPDWFDKLVAVNAEVSLHRAWFEALKEALLTDPNEALSAFDENIEKPLTMDSGSVINEILVNDSDIHTNALNHADNANP